MRLFFIFLVLIPLSNFSPAQGTSDDFKTTGQKLREKNISEDDICKMTCESKFEKCYDKQIKKAFGCLKQVIDCKKLCKKPSEKK